MLEEAKNKKALLKIVIPRIWALWMLYVEGLLFKSGSDNRECDFQAMKIVTSL